MADEKELKQARVAFETICEMLDDNGWRYNRDDDELKITSGARGDDLPVDLNMYADADRAIITIISKLPFDFPEDKRIEAAVIISMVNYNLAHGRFDYDITDGSLLFRANTSFKSSLLSKELMQYMLAVVCSTVDNYNDKFKAFADGEMNISDFIDFLNDRNK